MRRMEAECIALFTIAQTQVQWNKRLENKGANIKISAYVLAHSWNSVMREYEQQPALACVCSHNTTVVLKVATVYAATRFRIRACKSEREAYQTPKLQRERKCAIGKRREKRLDVQTLFRPHMFVSGWAGEYATLFTKQHKTLLNMWSRLFVSVISACAIQVFNHR